MHRTRALGLPTAVVAAALAVTIGAALAAPSRRSESAGSSGPAFRVRGHAAHLYPGAKTRMVVRVRNLERFRIVVTNVAASVGPASAPCPARVLRVRPWKGHRRLAPRATARVRLHVKLRRNAPLACLGARWPIAYTGKAFRP